MLLNIPNIAKWFILMFYMQDNLVLCITRGQLVVGTRTHIPSSLHIAPVTEPCTLEHYWSAAYHIAANFMENLFFFAKLQKEKKKQWQKKSFDFDRDWHGNRNCLMLMKSLWNYFLIKLSCVKGLSRVKARLTWWLYRMEAKGAFKYVQTQTFLKNFWWTIFITSLKLHICSGSSINV